MAQRRILHSFALFVFVVSLHSSCGRATSSTNTTNAPAKIYAPLKLSVTPQEVTPSITKNVTIRCYSEPADGSTVEEIPWLRILRKSSGSWELLAEMTKSEGVARSYNNLVSASGNVSDNAGVVFLEATWSEASEDTLAVYMCDAVGIDEGLQFVLQNTSEVKVTEKELTKRDLLGILVDIKTSLGRAIEKTANESRTAIDQLSQRTDKLEQRYRYG